jgi:soluble lytic murein transglycosylase-like protein
MVALVKNIRLLFLMVILINSANAEISVVNFEQTSSSVAGRKISRLAVSQSQKPGNYCWSSAEATYGVPAKLLVAIAKVETGINPSLVGKKNKDGSYDIGLMQINSGWLPKLSKYNITENDLFKPCTNIMVGAWILSDNIQRLGYNWDAVGAYNAKTNWKRDIYAKKVHKAILELGYNR